MGDGIPSEAAEAAEATETLITATCGAPPGSTRPSVDPVQQELAGAKSPAGSAKRLGQSKKCLPKPQGPRGGNLPEIFLNNQ